MSRQVPTTKKTRTQQREAHAQAKLESFALSPHKRALMYTGLPKKETLLQRLYKNHFIAYRIIETVLLITLLCYAVFTDMRLLLLVPLIGAAVFFKEYLSFIKWYMIIFIFKRDFYASRRRSYKDGGLLHYLNNWRPKVFRPTVNGVKRRIIIWAPTPKMQIDRFNRLQKNGTLESKEYISAL